MMSKGQVMSLYHGNIPRIPHGDQNPTKRYLKQDEILTLFDSRYVHIQEKVDGKLSCEPGLQTPFVNGMDIFEDMTGKNTCHKHIDYRELPPNKRILLDNVLVFNDHCEVYVPNQCELLPLDYCIIDGRHLRLEQIYDLLELISRMPSHFGRDRIEGLVIKNYTEQLFGKWINKEFEDHIAENP
jgi:hypothetical protein